MLSTVLAEIENTFLIILGGLRFEPGASGCEAQTLPSVLLIHSPHSNSNVLNLAANGKTFLQNDPNSSCFFSLLASINFNPSSLLCFSAGFFPKRASKSETHVHHFLKNELESAVDRFQRRSD